MSTISAADVKALRTQTGAGMMDCKRALSDAAGDAERAVELLRERGLAKAGKRAGRATSEGVVGLSLAGPVASIIELACETDFVARTDEYQALAQAIADLVAGDAGLSDAEATLAARLGDESVDARIQAAVAKLGENIELKRVAAAGGRFGGHRGLRARRRQARRDRLDHVEQVRMRSSRRWPRTSRCTWRPPTRRPCPSTRRACRADAVEAERGSFAHRPSRAASRRT